MGENNETFDVAAALAAAQASRDKLAERLYTPVWYHPLLGLGMAAVGLAAGLMADSSWAGVPLFLVGMGIMLGIAHAYGRITGVQLVEPAGSQSRRMQAAVALIAVALMFVGMLVVLRSLPWWAICLYVALVVAVITVLGRRYDAALRDDLRTSEAA